MRTIKTIRVFYLIYSVYTLLIVCVSDYKISHAGMGLLFMWLTYLCLHLGFASTKGKRRAEIPLITKKEGKPFPLSKISSWSSGKYMLAALATWVCAILSARYYTGKGIVAVIKGALGGASAYNDYQRFFLENNLGAFSLRKVPYIIMMAFMTIMLTWSIVGIILGAERIRKKKIAYLIMIVGAYSYFGMARGTNFETYIIFILFAFCLMQKMRNLINPRTLKYLSTVFIAGLALVFIYRARIMDRGVVFTNDICPEIHFNKDSIIARYFPLLTGIAISLFSYLGYGIYCMGVTVCDICFHSLEAMTAFAVPQGFNVFTGFSLDYWLAHTIRMEARWTPDFVLLIDLFGVILYIGFIFVLGKFLKKVVTWDLPPLQKNVIQAILFVEMLSIPVGNFLIASSSNELMVVYAILWLVWEKTQFTLKFSKKGK